MGNFCTWHGLLTKLAVAVSCILKLLSHDAAGQNSIAGRWLATMTCYGDLISDVLRIQAQILQTEEVSTFKLSRSCYCPRSTKQLSPAILQLYPNCTKLNECTSLHPLFASTNRTFAFSFVSWRGCLSTSARPTWQSKAVLDVWHSEDRREGDSSAVLSDHSMGLRQFDIQLVVVREYSLTARAEA